MKVYFPVSGEGMGHMGRSLALAIYLKEKGYEIVFGLYNERTKKMAESYGFDWIDIPKEWEMKGNNKGEFDYLKTLLAGLNYPYRYYKAVKKHKEIIRNLNPDILICDCLSAPLKAGKETGKKTYYINHQNIFSMFKKTLLIENMNRIYSKFYKLFILNNVEHVFMPDFFPPYHINEYHYKKDEKTIFVGPLIREDHYKMDEENQILICFGAASFRKKLYEYMYNLVDEFQEYKFIMVGQNIEKPNKDNLYIYDYLPDYLHYLSKSKALITQGGSSAIWECLCFGKVPIILCDKKHIEQKDVALKVNNMKAGIVFPINKYKEKMNEALENINKIDNSKYREMYLKGQNGKENIYKIIEQEL